MAPASEYPLVPVLDGRSVYQSTRYESRRGDVSGAINLTEENKMTEAGFQIDQIYRELINAKKELLSAWSDNPDLRLTDHDKTLFMIKAAAIFIANKIPGNMERTIEPWEKICQKCGGSGIPPGAVTAQNFHCEHWVEVAQAMKIKNK